MDFVFTVCDSAAGEACPRWPGQPVTAHWGIEDPAAVEGTDIDKERAFVEAFRLYAATASRHSLLYPSTIDSTSCARGSHAYRRIGRASEAWRPHADRHKDDRGMSIVRTLSHRSGCGLCIVAGIALGWLMPGVFQTIGAAEIAKVNLPVAVLIWLMIIPMLVKIDFAALAR